MSTWNHPDPQIRRANRVLRMVLELHKRGYQRIRVMPGMSPSGGYWRCHISHIGNFLRSHGARIPSEVLSNCSEIAHYSSSSGNEYFGWEDAKKDTAADLADKFIDRFPKIAKLGYGRDWPYVGWYVTMLGHADNGHLPIAYADFNELAHLLGGKQWDYDKFIGLSGTRDGLDLPPVGERPG